MSMLWTWVCLLLSIVIVLIGYEIVLTPNALKGKYNQTLCGNKTDIVPPAKRLVLFMVDALRDDTADSKWVSRIIQTPSRGIATAARPITRAGLVAIFSGRYEDILTSLPWFNHRTIEDNIFRHIDYTFYFGPDITRSYFRGSNHWISSTYPTKWLDVQGRTDLPDDYVMDSLQDMFDRPKHKEMNQKNIFYIHFSILDLVGHAARRGSSALQSATNKVSTNINKTATLFEAYFKDNGTAYIILSDHGMTDWGTHAHSLPEEIQTPLIMWGSGAIPGIHPSIRQLDICPLVAALLGIPTPAESIGRLQKGYLNLSMSSLAYSSMSTAVQLGNLCQTSWEYIDQGFLIKHVLAKTMTTCKYNKYYNKLMQLMLDKKYSDVINVAKNLTQISIYCLENIQNFYKTSFLFVLMMSYFSWIFGTICMLTVCASKERFYTTCTGKVIMIVTIMGYVAMTVFSIASVILEHLPIYYIVFIIVPSLAWLMTTLKTGICLTKLMKTNHLSIFVFFLAIIAMVEFTYWAKYYPYMFGGYLMPYSCALAALNHKFVPSHVTALWLVTSVGIIIAPLLPLLELPESAILLNVSSALWIVGSCFFGYVLDLKAKECLLTLALAAIICLSTWIIDLTYLGTNLILKILAWAVLPLPLLTFFASPILAVRLLQVVVSMAGPYLLLSVRHEAIVLLVFSLNLYCFLRLEASSPQFENQNLIRGLTLYYYTVLGVYAAGNVPYISSFHVTWTRLFITVLDDIMMGALIVYKLTIFLTVIACFFCAICYYIGAGLKEMLLISILAAAISSARHCLGIIFSKNPIEAMPEFILGNLLFLILILPFNVAPIFVNVKKNRNK